MNRSTSAGAARAAGLNQESGAGTPELLVRTGSTLCRLVGFEFGRVQLFVKICLSGIRDIIQPARNPLKETVFSKLWTAISRMSCGRTAELFNSGWRQVAMISDQLQDPIIGGDHPIGTLTHVVRGICGERHTNTDYRQLLVTRA